MSGFGARAETTTTLRLRETADRVPGSADGRDAPGGDRAEDRAVWVETVDLMKRDGLPDGDARVNGVCVLKEKIARLGIVFVMCDGGCAKGVTTEREDVGAVFASLRRR